MSMPSLTMVCLPEDTPVGQATDSGYTPLPGTPLIRLDTAADRLLRSGARR